MSNFDGRAVTYEDIKEIRGSIERLSDEVRACVGGQAEIRIQLAKDSVRGATMWAILAAVGAALLTGFLAKFLKFS